MKKISLIFLSAILCGLSYAKIVMPNIFGDNMLLQRDSSVKIWGRADANANVDVAFAGQKKSVKANSEGWWSLKLDKMSANKNPQEMMIYENGKLGKTIKNILVGEVWIAGGQSNMQWDLKRSTDADKFINQPENQLIRYFSQNTYMLSTIPKFTCVNGNWTSASPKTRGDYSAVAYLFAEKLQKDLDVPVGIVFGALGASKMIAWIPEDKVDLLEYTKNVHQDFITRNAKYDYNLSKAKWEKEVEAWKKRCEKLKAENKPLPRRPRIPSQISFLPPFATPCYLYNAVIAPVAPYSARGVLWYQGESDSKEESLKYFNEQFELVVKSWREKFENPNLAFIQVQLASFSIGDRDWGLTRWKQYLATKTISNCYMANIIDCGEEKDIHPKDKTTVANRVENIALNEIYGKKDVRAYGPIISSVKYNDNRAVVSFNTFGLKLKTVGEPRGFQIKVDDNWKDVQPVLNKDVVELVSNGGKKIQGVRYLWKNWARPDVWLFNEDGLPALSFINEKNN